MRNEMERVVITGIGIVSPIGCNIKEFKESLEKRLSGISKSIRIDTSKTKSKYTAEIKEYNPEKLISSRDILRVNRFTQIAAGASKLALDDAKIQLDNEAPEDIGLILSTDYGPNNTVNDYINGLHELGPYCVSPMLFSQTVMNVAVGYISVKLKLKGISTLIQGSDGFLFGYEHIKNKDIPTILLGGVDELAQNTFESYDVTNSIVENENDFILHGKNSKGTVLGEGGCVFVLESYNSAKANNRNVYAEIVGTGVASDTKNSIFITEGKNRNSSLALSMERAIESACIDKNLIEGIYSCANGSPGVDLDEYNALQSVFGDNLQDKWIVCGKSYYGECFNPSSFFNMALASIGLRDGVIYPNYRKTESKDRLFLLNDRREYNPSYVICNNIYTNGSNISVVLKSVRNN